MNLLANKENKKLLWITIIIFILAFLVFRPYLMQYHGLCYVGDDECYFAHATSLVFFQYPDYSKEAYGSYPGDYPPHSIGPAVMAFPFVLSFSLIDRIQNSPIIETRIGSSNAESWTLFGFVISTFFYFYLGILLLFKGLRHHFDENISFYSILFMILFQFFALYVFRRPILSHVYEFFLQSTLIFILLKDAKTKFLDNIKIYFYIIIGIAIGLIAIVRYNNILFSIFWPIVILCFRDKKFEFKKYFNKLAIIYFTGLIVSIFKIFLNIYYRHESYNLMGYIYNNFSLKYFLRTIYQIFFSLNFSFLFTAPFLIIALISLFIYKFDFKKQLMIIILPIIANFYFATTTSYRGWYGYRLVFFSLVPILIFPFALFLKKMNNKKKLFILILILLFLISIVPILSQLSYEGITKENEVAISQNNSYNYHVELFKDIVKYPKDFVISMLKGGPLYLIYVTANIFNLDKFLPAIVLEKYPFFNIRILIKTIIIYIFPFILYFLYILITQLKNKKLSKIT